MHVLLSREQEEFAGACRKVLERDCPISLVRDVADGKGEVAPLFNSVAALGWFELATPETDDGGLVELGIAYREAGRALAPTSLYSTIWAALCLWRADSASSWLPPIRRGELTATVAYAEEGILSLSTTDGYRTRARSEGGRWVLSGTKLFVPNAESAELLLVVAKSTSQGDDAVALFAIPRHTNGLEITPMATFGHDAQAVVTLNSVVVDTESLVIGPLRSEAWQEWFEAVNDRATALQCMEMLGGAERVLENTVAYIKERNVFGRPIGTFQAAQHHVANMGIALGAAKVACYKALFDAASDKGDARRSVSIAKSWLDKAYKETTIMAHQLFGAIGYVRETDLHLWSQRAKTTELTFGDRRSHLARLAALSFGEVANG